MNTAWRLGDDYKDTALRTANARHLRLVVDNTNPQPIPVFRLPSWFDRAGRVIWYSVIGLGIINVMNQIMLW